MVTAMVHPVLSACLLFRSGPNVKRSLGRKSKTNEEELRLRWSVRARVLDLLRDLRLKGCEDVLVAVVTVMLSISQALEGIYPAGLLARTHLGSV